MSGPARQPSQRGALVCSPHTPVVVEAVYRDTDLKSAILRLLKIDRASHLRQAMAAMVPALEVFEACGEAELAAVARRNLRGLYKAAENEAAAADPPSVKTA